MSLSNCVGAGHRHSALDRRLQTVGAAKFTRLTTEAVTGCAKPMEVHYGFEFHLLTDTVYT